MFFRKKNESKKVGDNLKKESGQMLMEAIVAVNLILIGLLGIISLLVKSGHTNRDLGTSLTATYLAAEGIEVIKNIIDTDVAGGQVWNKSVETGNAYEVDFLTTGGKLNSLVVNEGTPLKPLNIDGGGMYSYEPGTETVFRRKVVVSAVSGDYQNSADVMRVESFVSISPATCNESKTEEQKGCARIQDEFYNWRKIK